jgi:two-component system, cell cycle sensor histidine kinase and response regulator CckA
MLVHHLTVLLVDDEPAGLASTRDQLRSLGYEVIAAPDPVTALHVVHGFPRLIDVLLLSASMRLMEGRELADVIARSHPNVPTIFMSGGADPLRSATRLRRSGEILIQKPFGRRELDRALRSAVKHATARRSRGR